MYSVYADNWKLDIKFKSNNTLDQEIVIDELGNISGGKRFEEAVDEDYLYALSVLRKYWESSIKQLGITYQDLYVNHW